MAGYCGYSKSNNALDAEAQGKMTASALARKIGGGATAAGVAEVLEPCEWHHTSKHYNRTNYYDIESDVDALATERASDDIIAGSSEDITLMAGIRDELYEKIREASRELKSKTKASAEVFEGCHVEWIEWAGTRNHPKAIPHSADNCRVEVKGDWAIISGVHPSGYDMNFRKKLTTRGFSFEKR